MRVTTYPSQFVVLSSLNPNVIKNSIKQLKHHAWIFDKMGLDESPYYSINIHGGVRDKKILCSSINELPDNIRKRLTLENDELSYNVKDLFEIYKSTNIPICFDSHHHPFNDASLSGEDAMGLRVLHGGLHSNDAFVEYRPFHGG
jgi:UV DNA damage endonuclease